MNLHLVYFNDIAKKPQGKIGYFHQGFPEDLVQVYELSRLSYSDRFDSITLTNGSSLPEIGSSDLVLLYTGLSATDQALSFANALTKKEVTAILAGPASLAPSARESEHINSVLVGPPQTVWNSVADSFLAGDVLAKTYAGTLDQSPYVLDTYPNPSVRIFQNYYGSFFNVELGKKLNTKPLQVPVNNIADISRKPADVERLLEVSPSDVPLFFSGLDAFVRDHGKETFFETIAKTRPAWVAEVSAEICRDQKFAQQLVKHGCQLLLLDIHSFSETEMIRHFNGEVSFADVECFLSSCNTLGLRVFVQAQFGFNDETLSVFEEAYQWMKQIGFERWLPQLHVTFPGTKAYEFFAGTGPLLERPLSRYDGYHLVYTPATSTAEEWEKAFYEFHQRVNRYAFRKVIIEQNV